MSSCKLVIKDEVNVKFENLSLEWRKRLSNKFKYEIPYARHLPAVKLGRWDGKVSFFGLGGTTYLNLVDQILPILEEGGVYVDFEDHREQHNFEFKAVDKDYLAHITWPEHHPCAGQPIQLRDYQVETINKFIENPTVHTGDSHRSRQDHNHCGTVPTGRTIWTYTDHSAKQKSSDTDRGRLPCL
jgi:hypothetical protein